MLFKVLLKSSRDSYVLLSWLIVGRLFLLPFREIGLRVDALWFSLRLSFSKVLSLRSVVDFSTSLCLKSSLRRGTTRLLLLSLYEADRTSLAFRSRFSKRGTLGGVLGASLVPGLSNLCLSASMERRTGSKSFGALGGLNKASSFLESLLFEC